MCVAGEVYSEGPTDPAQESVGLGANDSCTALPCALEQTTSPLEASTSVPPTLNTCEEHPGRACKPLGTVEHLPSGRKNSLIKIEPHMVDLKRKCLFSCYKVITNSSKKKKQRWI